MHTVSRHEFGRARLLKGIIPIIPIITIITIITIIPIITIVTIIAIITIITIITIIRGQGGGAVWAKLGHLLVYSL